MTSLSTYFPPAGSPALQVPNPYGDRFNVLIDYMMPTGQSGSYTPTNLNDAQMLHPDVTLVGSSWDNTYLTADGVLRCGGVGNKFFTVNLPTRPANALRVLTLYAMTFNETTTTNNQIVVNWNMSGSDFIHNLLTTIHSTNYLQHYLGTYYSAVLTQRVLNNLSVCHPPGTFVWNILDFGDTIGHNIYGRETDTTSDYNEVGGQYYENNRANKTSGQVGIGWGVWNAPILGIAGFRIVDLPLGS